MRCKLLLAVGGRGGRDVTALCASGEFAEVDFDWMLAEAGLRYDDVLSKLPDAPGLYVWEGTVSSSDDGFEYFHDTYRALTPEEWALLAAGTMQLWPRGPTTEPGGPDDDKEGPEVGGIFG